MVSYRHELVEDRTAQANRLHADLGKLRPGYQQNIRRLTTRKALDGALRLLWRDMSPHARIAKGRIRALRDLDRRIKDLTSQIEGLVNRTGTSLCDIYGVGTLVAATILAEVGNPRRYGDQSQVRHGQWDSTARSQLRRVVRHRLNRGGNRRLNRAIHTVALTQIARPDTEGRRYYQKLRQRGKTNREALRVLKRRISDRIWTHLQQLSTVSTAPDLT